MLLCWPNLLKILTLCNSFNNSLDYLPNTITNLTIGNGCLKYFGRSCKFNQPLDNLPNSLKKITLSGYYVGSIDDLSDNIETIILGPTWFKYNNKTYYH